MKHFASSGLDYIISTAINLKMSYIEHQFYGKVEIIRYFMQAEVISNDYINVLDNNVIRAIEQLYFTTSKQRKMLLDVGIYERDIDTIVHIIGEDYQDAFEMKKLLQDNANHLKKISYISKYIIENL